MKVRCLLTLIFCSLLVAGVNAQDEEEEPKRGFDKNKLFFGGNFGLSFGNLTLVNISPQVGYRFNRTLAAGTGVTFIYSSYKNFGYKESYGVAGLNIFGRVYPIEYVFLQLQPELNYTWGKLKYDDGFTPDQKLEGKFAPSLLAGAGAAIPAGRGAFIVMAQYDILQNARTPYGEKVFFSFGYNFGF